MSGTSADGIDVALLKITGHYTHTQVQEIAFASYPLPAETKQRVLALAHDEAPNAVAELCRMNFELGTLFGNAALRLAREHGITQIDLVGSHGQTVHHLPDVPATLQIGEGAVIAHLTGAITVSDFRVGDVAAGGIGAPLVPYTEFLLHSNPTRDVALQNIGGIGNITYIPKGADIDEVIAFDTGPGNMVMDYFMQKVYHQPYDENGATAAKGTVHEALLAHALRHPYFAKVPPKATGREQFGKAFCEELLAHAPHLPPEDVLATATALTAVSIAESVRYLPAPPQRLIISGGGAYNPTLLHQIAARLPHTTVLSQEQTGNNSDAKEAIAFAILANETIHGHTGNLPAVTGASTKKILGKIHF